MTIPQYSPERRRSLAKELGIEEQYLYQISKGLRVASPALARSLNRVDPQAQLQDLRPDDWHLIWPELALQPIRAEGACRV
ncbi:hypothetical protein DR66_4047 [Delftia acidovorans]|uniref:hypothetical protein n=1 Tax=Delftia acidovorans TaxID=80866 RepID=UPI000503068B|nr:hypothetical protein [Delftia acidovorans]KFJ13260.1 hypothetical protein DR66_4047 [Delftia acidovorans]QQB53385.1 hypothetical protein I6H54_14540 [Delftia acidovorans]